MAGLIRHYSQGSRVQGSCQRNGRSWELQRRDTFDRGVFMLHCCRYDSRRVFSTPPPPSCPMVQPVSLPQTGYPLLSTHYHLVPGAFLVSSESGNSALACSSFVKDTSCRFTVGVASSPRNDEWNSYYKPGVYWHVELVKFSDWKCNWGNFSFFSSNNNPSIKHSDLSSPELLVGCLSWLL